MLSVSLGIFLAAVLIFIIILFRLSLFSKISVNRAKFDESKVVYRIVKGNFEALQKEQSIYTRRAQSLWGKEMLSWPTFRITYPTNKIISIFGIVVPDSFDCDPECLQELGFTPGKLGSLHDTAIICVPARCCTAVKLNQLRARKCFELFFKENKELNPSDAPFAEFRQKKTRRQTFLRPLGSLSGLWAPDI